jgi:hypothetical protein
MRGSWLLDGVFIVGLAMLAAGLYLVSLPLMLAVVGSVLMILALIGAWRGRT